MTIEKWWNISSSGLKVSDQEEVKEKKMQFLAKQKTIFNKDMAWQTVILENVRQDQI